MSFRKQVHAPARLAALALVVSSLVACDDRPFQPRVSSPDWSEAQLVADLEVRGRMAQMQGSLDPVAQVRFENSGSAPVQITLPAEECILVIRGYPDPEDETPAWEPPLPIGCGSGTVAVELSPGEVEVFTQPIRVDAQLQSLLRRYRWMVVTGTVTVGGQTATMELGELLR